MHFSSESSHSSGSRHSRRREGVWGCRADGPPTKKTPAHTAISYRQGKCFFSHQPPVSAPRMSSSTHSCQVWKVAWPPSDLLQTLPKNHDCPHRRPFPCLFWTQTCHAPHHGTTKTTLGRKQDGSTGINLGKENYLR